MRGLLKAAGTVLLFLAAALCFAPTVVPPFLDRIYYQGEPSGHFDGERFFNPDGASPLRRGTSFLTRWATASERAQWPDQVPVTPTVPPRRVDGEAMRVTWIGHATVLVQTAGLNILTDPIWSERASPFSFVGPKRVRAPGVRFEDLPRIDLVLVSHNHYDHLDLATLRRLWERDRPAIVTSLGNDAILRNAGIESTALDWDQWLTLTDRGVDSSMGMRCDPDAACPGDRARVFVNPNHHWSSRWFTDRNRALWTAFTIVTPEGRIFFAGDTGWGDGRWVDEAAAAGPYRLAIIPIGAYEPRDFMKNSHVDPAEAVAMFERLRPGAALGIHWGTFQLTFEPIDEPRQRLEALKRAGGIAPERFRATEAGHSFEVPRL